MLKIPYKIKSMKTRYYSSWVMLFLKIFVEAGAPLIEIPRFFFNLKTIPLHYSVVLMFINSLPIIVNVPINFVSQQKIKELAYMHSEGILSGELKHGPLALIDKEMPVVMVISNDSTYDVS